MSSLIETKRRLLDHLRTEGASPVILKAFEDVPREEFVPRPMKALSYADQPLAIGFEQTISQPTTILRMLMLLELSPGMIVLEIGAGSGYVCALLAELGCSVIGLEIVPELAVRAGKILDALHYNDRVAVHAADGGGGWAEGVLYDRILVSAACPEVPRHLFPKLKNDGILVAPVGRIEQRMIVCRKNPPSLLRELPPSLRELWGTRRRAGNEKDVIEEDHGAYVFVPLTGRYGGN